MGLDKQTAVYPDQGMVLSNKRGQATATCDSMNEPGKHHAFVKEVRCNRPHTCTRFHFYDASSKGRPGEQKVD